MCLSVRAAQGQLDAYNAHDVETFIKWYTEDVKVYDLDSDELLYEGKKIMKERYTNLFNKKGLICKLINRMVLNGTIIDHEDAFIDLAFQMGPLEGLKAEEAKQYIRFIGNRRLEQLGLNPIYDVQKNPLTWLDNMLNGVEHMNFFEGRATEYSKASTKGSWGEVFA